MERNAPISPVTTTGEPTTPRPISLREWLALSGTRDLGRALLFASPAIIIFSIFTYLPFFHAIFLSLNVTNNQGEAARFNGLGYYARVLGLDGTGRTDYLQSILTSFQFALLVVPPVILVALSLALLATAQVRGIQVFRTIFTSSIAISLASAGVIWALIYSPSTKATTWLVELLNLGTPGLLSSDATALPAVAVMTIWSGIGFNFIITLSGLQAIPVDLYESAAIDGANRIQSFRFITLPMLSPTLLFLFVINTIGSLQAFTQFFLLLPDRTPTVYVYETFLAFWGDNRYGLASAMSIILFVILLILTSIQYGVLNRRVNYS